MTVRTLGKYRLLERLASGGMADVWRAEVANAEGVVKEVALKLVRGEHAADDAFVRMFIQEARLASRLAHANVVQVIGFDQLDGQYVLAMELVRGRHLGQVVERCRERGLRFGLPRAIHVAAEVAKGLAYAHRLADGPRPLGLVHRDVSPHNVLVSFEGEVKLADFGIARVRNLAGLTQPGTLKGKLAYMAPEQARGEDVDARADVFALGVVLWELLAGRRLFARETEAATFGAVLGPEPISPPSAWNEAVPPELDAVVLGALERDAERRTASAQELATALGGILLRTARSPEEFDLRALMHALWPDGTAASGPRGEPTRVRTPEPPVAMAREPVAERTAPQAAAAAGATVVAPRPDRPETATRTSVAGARRRAWVRRGRIAGATVVVGAIVAVGGVVVVPGRGGEPGKAVRTRPEITARLAAPASTPSSTPNPSMPLQASSASPSASAEKPTAEQPSAERPSASAEKASAKQPSATAEKASADAGPPRAKCINQLVGVPVPPPASNHGLVSIDVAPWARVLVDGRPAGYTPCTLRLPAGAHRLRATHETKGDAQLDLVIAAGTRRTWFPTLSR